MRALTALPKLILTPHIGWPTDKMYEQFAGASADALPAYPNCRAVPGFADAH